MTRLQIVLALGLVLLFGSLIARAWWTNDVDRRLCNVIHAQVAGPGAMLGKPHTPGYAYYRKHPDELRVARQQNQALLNELPCKGD